MQMQRILVALFLFLAIPLALAEKPSSDENKPESHEAGLSASTHGDDDEHAEGLSANAPVIFKWGSLQITNSMFVTMIVALGIIIIAQMATSNIQLIPSGLQNFVELLVESLYGFFESIVGADMVKKTFWFFGTTFIFILFANWFGLIPGIGTIGYTYKDYGLFHNHHLDAPLMRGVNADVNMTFAMAGMFMVLWLYWSLKALGPGGFIGHIFNVKGHGSGFFGVFLVLVFIFVGFVEIVSISVRPVALTFRLYGNVFAGENILETVMKLGGPWFGWLAVLPFYLLELLVGLVQALVFSLLAAVFTALMCEQHGDEHGEEHAH